MVDKILADTNILIEHLRLKQGRESLFSKYVQNRTLFFVAGVTIAEIWQGASTKQEKEQKTVTALLNNLEIVIPDYEIQKLSGVIRRDSHGEISLSDAQIAATSIVHDLPLLTLNLKDFKNINGLNLVEIQNI